MILDSIPALLQKKSKQLHVPYQNLLIGSAREVVLEQVATMQDEIKVAVMRTNTYGESYYKNGKCNRIFLRIVDQDLTKDLVLKILNQLMGICDIKGLSLNGVNQSYQVDMDVKFGPIKVPIQLYLSHGMQKKNSGQILNLPLIYEEGKELSIPVYDCESEVIEIFVEYRNKLELFSDMEALETLYSYGATKDMDGRFMGTYLEECVGRLSESDVEIICKTAKNRQLKDRYTFFLHSRKLKEPTWTMFWELMEKMMLPILESNSKEQIFLGDWTSEVGRYL